MENEQSIRRRLQEKTAIALTVVEIMQAHYSAPGTKGDGNT